MFFQILTVSRTLSDRIARFLFTYRNTPQTTTGMSPAELLFGRRLRSRLDLLKPDLYKRVEREQERQKEAHDRHSQDRSLLALYAPLHLCIVQVG